MNDLFDSIDVGDEVENEDDSPSTQIRLLDGVLVSDSDWTAETILSQLSKGNIVLTPRFQRRDAWSEERKSRFIESLLLGIPIPQLVLAELPGHKGRYLVIDGKQRLLSLQAFAGVGSAPLRLKDLTVRSDLNGLNWSDIQTGAGRTDDVSAFENAPIRTTFIKGYKHEKALYLIFHRLNSGSVPLSPQELRHVLHPGPFIDFAFDMSEQNRELIELFGKKGKPDFRMRDVEMLIRFFAFRYFLELYRGDLKEFLDTTVERLNRDWGACEDQVRAEVNEFVAAITTTQTLFGPDAFAKFNYNRFESRFNRAVFDTMVFYFADPQVREAAERAGGAVKEAYKALTQQSLDFRFSVESTTKSIDATLTRLSEWGSALGELLGFPPPGLERVRELQKVRI